ncbi:carcinoembryonic antigen-related cell adhesion molecule 5 [Electrophorus electricus]|uniref:carcinoembryonic antigen-related cell adhesion molecule 5 n=1 Tax=Electrophorus electricus TaxID=8005 RepID=UPI0015CF82D6|nr:carcinoembryonic antigen-related cell adhesion molecule 5 [Electrophorus electricus]XP_026872077.2 carcinoembryonic antigen-related cell adhesion molecule 5 [Electrophorus electricus]
MDFYNFRLLLLILTAIGCRSGDSLLPPNISGVIGRNVTFPTALPASISGVASLSWTFKSPTQPQPSPVYTRLNDNEKVASGYVGRILCNKTTFALQLGPLTSMDGGTYSLSVITLDMVTLTAETILEVLEAVADVKVIYSPREPVEINSTVVLTCVAQGSSLSYNWMNGSAPVVADGQHVTLNRSQLIISSVFRGDLLGPIYCIAQNKLESARSPVFNLTVSYGPEKVAMTRVPTDEVLKKGSNMTLSCTAQSSPVADLLWLLNGVLLPMKGSTLYLSGLTEEQSGNYTCMAYNNITRRYTVSQVTTVSIIEAISGTNINGPASLLIAGNSTANLTCKALAGKADRVVWFKDGKSLETTPRVILNGDKSTVSILEVQKEDAGKYSCHLINSVNTDIDNYVMVINYGPENVKITGVKQVEVVDTVVMTCLAASVPAPTYVWKFNGTVLDTTTAEYKINKPDYRNSGIYTCEAYNPITGLTNIATHSLLVKGEGELHDQLSDGAIAAIVITVLIILAVIIAFIIHKKRKVTDIPSPY